MRNKMLIASVIVLILVGITVGTGAVLYALSDYQPALNASASGSTTTAPTGKPVKQVNLTLQTFPQSPDSLPQWEAEHHYALQRNTSIPVIDPHLDWVTYGPSSNLVVPAYSKVTITIKQYDSGVSLLNDFYSNVRGTIGNTMTVDGKTGISHLNPTLVAHTFTIHGIPSNKQPWLFVSVPLERLSNSDVNAGVDNGLPKDPHIIKFSFYVYGPGHYVWQCEYPCGNGYDGFGGAMSTHGYMNGTFTVV